MISIEGTTINNQLYKFDNDIWKIKKTLQWYHGMTSWCMTTSWQLDDDIANRATTTYICRFHAMIHHIADIIAWHLICQYHGMTTTLISWHDITDDILAISWQYHNDIMYYDPLVRDTKIGYQKIPDTMQQIKQIDR